MTTVYESTGYKFEIEDGRIITAVFGSYEIHLEDEVKVNCRYAKRLGLEEGRIGKVLVISKPDTAGLTSNIIGVDFLNCGHPTAQLKIYELVTNMALRA